ncbi:iron-containing alcohol dehydrogenase [Paralimibaculum aggregatum]|uniref:Iron-containing alcohol dehydrogenase n=1 Tax=Paralimibaculum aggregatum TaxID=3036245 RepID=A0ABQ6LHK2_9RHOB|nr:iron-containing alcohol dehydrogenase [Limibaculum sp. NKW23]GMG82774.1 iron-containing alcohol dehydrogenase [Limibaculum sp. NKW23]
MTLITYLTRIHFADGVLEDALKAELEALGIARPLVVTDRAPGDALRARMLAALPEDTAPALAELPARPDEAAAMAALERYRAGGCDGILGFGTGPALDLAKALRVLAGQGGRLAAYAVSEGGGGRIRCGGLAPMIAVPTTAGSGSEVAPDATVLGQDGRALTLSSRHLVPSAAICDPTLTLAMAPRETAETGMDALSRCIETYLARGYNPPADGIALDGLARAAGNLRRACAHGDDLAARREMMAAALNGALALQKGLGAAHAIAHALGALPGVAVAHGAVNAVMLPHVLAFNAPAIGDRLGAIRAALGLPPDAVVSEALVGLAAEVAMPGRLGEMGLTAAHVEAAAPLAERDRHNGTNPRRASGRDYAELMHAAL